MRKLSIAIITLSCGAIIVIGLQLGIQGSSPQAATSTPMSTMKVIQQSSPAVILSSPSPVVTSVTPTNPPAVAKIETITGDAISTQYGSVQVAVTFNGQTITDVKAIQLTNSNNRSVAISNNAAPQLRSSVLSSQSAHVASVSGATYTSDGYLNSVQSAIDKHHV